MFTICVRQVRSVNDSAAPDALLSYDDFQMACDEAENRLLDWLSLSRDSEQQMTMAIQGPDGHICWNASACIYGAMRT